MGSYQRQTWAILFIGILASSTWADPLVTGLMQAATKEVVRNWMQSRARGSLTEELSATARGLSNEIAERTGGFLTVIAASPLLLPLWLPLMFFGSAFFVTSLAPSLIPELVRGLTPVLNQINPLLSSFGFDDYARSLEPEHLQRSLQPDELLERSLNALDVEDHECKRKMFCEIGNFTRDRNLSIAKFLHLFSETVNRIFPRYADPLMRGLQGTDCVKLYARCAKSPFGNTVNYYFTKDERKIKEKH